MKGSVIILICLQISLVYCENLTTSATIKTTTTTLMPVAQMKVGEFKTKDHGVNGTLYIIGENSLLLKGFSYDGKNLLIEFIDCSL